jgi:hypothetical protein
VGSRQGKHVPTRLADLKGDDGLPKREDLPGAAHAAAEEITKPTTRHRGRPAPLPERAYEGARP